MVTITQALTTVIWYGTGTQLSSTILATKALIVRQVNGTGYSSFDPAPAQAAFNSLQSVTTGAVLIVESTAAAIQGAGYPLDNGTAPTGTASAPISWPSFGDAGTGPYTEIDGLINVSQAYLPSFAFTTGAGTLQMQLNGSGTWAAAGAISPGDTVQFRIANNTPTAPFAGNLTLTPQ